MFKRGVLGSVFVLAFMVSGCAINGETSWTNTANEYVKLVNRELHDAQRDKFDQEVASQSNAAGIFLVAIRYPTSIDGRVYTDAPYKQWVEGDYVDPGEVSAKSTYYAMELYSYLSARLPKGSVALWPVKYEYGRSGSAEISSTFGDVVSLFVIDISSYSDFFVNKIINARECYVGTCYGQQFMFDISIHTPRRMIGISCSLRFPESRVLSTKSLDPSPIGVTILDAGRYSTCLEDNYREYIQLLGDPELHDSGSYEKVPKRQMGWVNNDKHSALKLDEGSSFVPIPRAQMVPNERGIKEVSPESLNHGRWVVPHWNGLIRFLELTLTNASSRLDFGFEVAPKINRVRDYYNVDDLGLVSKLMEIEKRYVSAFSQQLFESTYLGEFGRSMREYLAAEATIGKAGNKAVGQLLLSAGVSGMMSQGGGASEPWFGLDHLSIAHDVVHSTKESSQGYDKLSDELKELVAVLGGDVSDSDIGNVTNQRTLRRQLKEVVKGNQ